MDAGYSGGDFGGAAGGGDGAGGGVGGVREDAMARSMPLEALVGVATSGTRGLAILRFVLEVVPEFEELGLDERVELVAQGAGRVEGFDEFLDVGEIFEAVGVGHSGGEFKFDEGFEFEVADAVDFDGDGCGVGEGDGFGFSVAGEFAGDEEFDSDAGAGVAEVAAACEGGDVAQAVEMLMDGFVGFCGDEDVDVDGGADETVRTHGHRTDDDARDIKFG